MAKKNGGSLYGLGLEQTSNGISYQDFIESVHGSTIILYPSEDKSKSEIDKAKRELRGERDVVKMRVADDWDLDDLYKTAIFRDERVKTLKWYQVEQDEKLIRKERKKGTTPQEFVTDIVLPNVKETEKKYKKEYGKSIYEMKNGGEIKGDYVLYTENEDGRDVFISDHNTYRGAKTKMTKLWNTGEYDRLGVVSTRDWETFHAPYAFDNGGSVTNSLHTVEVMFKDPKYNYFTSVSPTATEESSRKYFVGKKFNVESFPKEQMEEVVDIRFIKNPNAMENGDSTYKGGGEILDWMDMRNDGMRNCFVAIYNDLANSEFAIEDYKVDSLKNVVVYFREEKFSDVEKQKLNRFLQKYTNQKVKPEFCKFIKSTEIDGNRVYVYSKEQIYSKGGSIKKGGWFTGYLSFLNW